ncbi:hypothetical protein PHMEG_00031160 [Phytophthora megakarya]|uniref:Uncharacterized protein n=1 Tax=Phytophthora megakarya TaxID=4795 RepID=A0A225UXB4_9STRA|nr:hypothetical protein PHMEG_00031160 [Phytophthora megakarya]
MDLLLEQQDLTDGAVTTNHCQIPGNQVIASTVLVDDVIDVATTRAGIESRVEISNIFTGIHATGGVFGASKSFLLHYQPGRHTHEDTVYLNDGLGIPQPVTVVSPAEGFKHLGISQSTDDIWSKTLRPVWQQLKRDAANIIKCQLTAAQLQYVVNSVWIPRMQYRTQLGTSLKAAHQVDKLVRHVARNVLKLPYGTPREIFHDTTQGIGLTSFVDACNVSRVQLALRVHNSPHISAYHLLVESLEMYQVLAGLTGHPLEFLLEPPSHLQGWIHQTLRAAARLGVKASVEWTNPAQCVSERPNDRPIWGSVCVSTQQKILRFNVKYASKVRFIGDIADSSGLLLSRTDELARRGCWSRRQYLEFTDMEAAICRQCCIDGTRILHVPVGRTLHSLNHLQMTAVDVPPDGFFIVSQYVVRDTNLEFRGYELGQRVGDRITENELGLGMELDVQWWHERRPGSDVWTLRPEGRGTDGGNSTTQTFYKRTAASHYLERHIESWSSWYNGQINYSDLIQQKQFPVNWTRWTGHVVVVDDFGVRSGAASAIAGTTAIAERVIDP